MSTKSGEGQNDYYEHINDEMQHTISINTSICQRELGQIKIACQTIENVIKLINKVKDIEVKIEIYLVASKTYLTDNNFKVALEYATIAINLIDNRLLTISRLHYRRGVRENYIRRINQIILDSVEFAAVEEMIDLMIFSKLNSFSDWLSVLEWYKEIKNDYSVMTEVKEDLGNKIEGLISFGAPILYGFHEKYDDPFEDIEDSELPFLEAANFSTTWRKFNFAMTKIVNTTKHKKPYKYSSVNYLRDAVLADLNKNKSYIFIYVHNGSINFIHLSKKQVNVAKTEIHSCAEYLDVLGKYQFKEATFSQFTYTLHNCVEILSNDLNQMLDYIVNISSNEVVIVPDKLVYTVPVVPVLLEHNDFRKKLRQGKIKLKYCPVLYKSQKEVTEIENGIGIITPADDLPLLEEEMLVPMKHLDIQSWKTFDLSNGKLNYQDEEVRNTDIIHIASHGFPISKFTDPIFASIAGKLSPYTISTEEIQSKFWKLNYGLVITNACDSADTSSRNYQKSFETNEIISYSSLFMLNGKGNSITVNWPIKDILSYIFSYLFYKILSQGSDYQSSYNLALAKIYDLKREDVIRIISSIEDESKRKQKLNLFSNPVNEYPLRNPYCYGGFIFTSLL